MMCRDDASPDCGADAELPSRSVPPRSGAESGGRLAGSGRGLAAACLLLLLALDGHRRYESSHGESDGSAPFSAAIAAPRALRGRPAKNSGARGQGEGPNPNDAAPRAHRALWGWGFGTNDAPPPPPEPVDPPQDPATAKPGVHEPFRPGFADGEPVDSPPGGAPYVEPKAPVPKAPPAQPANQMVPSTHLPRPTDQCEDDPRFVNAKLKTCDGWVAHVGRVPLHQARCGQGTGIIDEDGEELLVKHFCRESCGVCGDGKWAVMEREKNNEYAGQLAGEAEGEIKKAEEAEKFEEAVQHAEGEMTPGEMEMIEEDIAEGLTLDAGVAGEVEEEAALQELEAEEVERGCADDATFAFEGKTCANYVTAARGSGAAAERCKEGLGQLLSIADFCPRACGLCEDGAGTGAAGAAVAEAPPAAAEPAAKPPANELPAAEAPAAATPVAETPAAEPAAPEPGAPAPSDGCADDPTFVHADGHDCGALGALAAFPEVLSSLCGQPAGGVDGSGKELRVGDFCAETCGACGERVQPSEEPVAEAPAAEPAAKATVDEAPVAQTAQEGPAAVPAESSATSEHLETPAAPAQPVSEMPAANEKPSAEEGEVASEFASRAPPAADEAAPRPEPAVEPPAEPPVAEAPAAGRPAAQPPAQSAAAPPAPLAGCADDPTFVHSDGNNCGALGALAAFPELLRSRCRQSSGRFDGGGNELLVGDFCAKTCGACPEAPGPVEPATGTVPRPAVAAPAEEAPAAEEPAVAGPVANVAVSTPPPTTPPPTTPPPTTAPPTTPPPTTAPPTPEPVPCVDAPLFVHSDGKRCADLAPLAAFPSFLQSICDQATGITGGSGKELLVSDFCIKSCGNCP